MISRLFSILVVPKPIKSRRANTMRAETDRQVIERVAEIAEDRAVPRVPGFGLEQGGRSGTT